MKKKVKKQELEDVRQTYLENRAYALEDFAAALEEVQLDEPSVGGKIAGMDYQQFSAWGVFNAIVEQEEYVLNKHKSPWVLVEEEQVILADMVKRAQEVFGKEYDAWYKHCKDERR